MAIDELSCYERGYDEGREEGLNEGVTKQQIHANEILSSILTEIKSLIEDDDTNRTELFKELTRYEDYIDEV